MNLKNTVNFIFEVNQLKRQRHSGFQLAGVKEPDSIAEHVMRAAQIGYILAVMEGDANPEKVASITKIKSGINKTPISKSPKKGMKTELFSNL